jgi:hypothetical protein
MNEDKRGVSKEYLLKRQMILVGGSLAGRATIASLLVSFEWILAWWG